MNQEIKARWVAALRSGEYIQDKGFLNRDGKFCCLGVLCEIAVADGVIRKWEGGHSHAGFYYGPDLGDRRNTDLPLAVVHWANLNHRTPALPSEVCVCSPGELEDNNGCACPGSNSLIGLNDDTDIGFEGIANAIEEHL